MSAAPPLSIGLPVYNGENFLEETLRSVLEQTWGDFRIVITDNCSTDATEEICRDFAGQDGRIDYHLNDENLGAAVNYQRCFHLSDSPYFRWQAHDDPAAPTLLERCMEAITTTPDAALAYARTESIDTDGNSLKVWRRRPALSDPDPLVRVHDVLTKQETFPIWGIVPRRILEQTPLLGSFTEHDRPLLYELALHGPFVEIDEPLFYDREHAGRSVRAFDHADPYVAVEWYDSRYAGRLIFPAWRLLREYVAALRRAPVPHRDIPRHLAELTRWCQRNSDRLQNDLLVGAEHAPLLGGSARRFRTRRDRRAEASFLDGLERDLHDLPDGTELIVIDETVVDRAHLERLTVLEFPEVDGVWGGLPASSAEACAELDRRRRQGVTHLALLAPSAWWLDHFDAFAAHLDDIGTRILESGRVTLVELSPDQIR